MKNTRLALLLATSLIGAPALAASVTMLQFGSFETKDEAEKRLSEIKSKHSSVVGGLGTSIREVKLPPDNLTVFRTQAGPVESRASAQSICAKMASSGDECYIVQTAMVAPESASTKVTDAAPAPVVAPKTNTLPDTAALEKPSNGTPDLTTRLSTLNNDATRDASSRQALTSLSTAPEEVASVDNSAAVKMNSALDEAASKQGESTANVTEATASTPVSTPNRSFWSRLNPFSSEPAPAPVKQVAKAPEVIAAPVEEVTSTVIAAPAVIAEPAPVAAMETTPRTIEMAAVAPAAAPAPAALPAFDTTPVIMHAEPMVLPPPPAPLRAEDRALLAAEVAAMNPPVSTGEIAAPVAMSAGQPPLMDGTVRVEEAKRVPLTEGEVPAAPAVLAVAAPEPVKPLQPPVSLVPSSTNGQKTLWAQIGPFTDAQTALEFWGNYRQNHPDFPVVRVRVTSPYQMQRSGVNQSWLRVGPVARGAFIKSLCSSLPKDEASPKTKQLRCGSVADIGVSSAAKISTGVIAPSRYKR